MTTIPALPFSGQQLRDTLTALDGAIDTKEASGAAASAVAAHVAAADPHTQYTTTVEAAAAAPVQAVALSVPAGWGGTSANVGGNVTLTLALPAGSTLVGSSDRTNWNTAASDVTSILARLSKLQYANCIYVAESGHDLNNTGTIDSPLRTLGAAAVIAMPGDVVHVAPGTYVEPVLPIRWRYDVTVLSSGLRSCVVQGAPGQEFNDIFKVDSGFWCWGLSFAGHQADATRQAWAVSFDELADNTARGAVDPGAFILKSPYIQNCTSITAEDDAGTAGSQSTGNTGGGIRIDGSACAANSPIRSMVVDSYTQVNLGGPGCLVLRDGYAQLVSFFGTFCTYHVRTESGGQVNLSGGGTTDFGVYGLMADGYSPSPLYTGGARLATYGATRLERAVTIDPATDLLTATAHGLQAGDQLSFTVSNGELPGGLTANTTYHVIASGLTADAFRVSATAGGATVNITGSASGTYQFLRQGATEIDVVGLSANRLGRQIKYPSAGSLGSTGSPVSISARGGSTAGSSFTVTLGTSTILHEYVGGGTVTVSGASYPITSASYSNATGVTVLTASGYAPTVGASITLAGLSFICSSASRPNAGQLMFPQLVFPRNASTGAAETKAFAYTRTSSTTLTYAEAASPNGPEHEYVSGGTAVIGGVDYGVAGAVYDKTTGVVTLTTKQALPAGNGTVTVGGLAFICPTSAYVVTSSVPIDASGTPVAADAPTRAGYRVIFYSGPNGGLRDPITAGQKLDFRNRSQISAPSHTFEFVGSGTNYDALPWNGGVGNPANAIVETNNGRVYSSNTNEKGDFKVGSQFEVDGTTGSVTFNTNQFNLSGLNFIGPFSRNGGISTVGEQLRELSNNASLISSTGGPDGNTAPTQSAVKTYADSKFLQDVTVTAGLPLTISDTSSQDGQGYWTRRRNLSLSVNTANGLARLDGSGLIPAALLPSTDAVSEGSVNLYFTTARARQAISASGSLGYDPVTGVISYTAPTLATVATTGAYSDLTGRPTLGTAAALNAAATGDAAAGEVVKGGDARLSDAREWSATTIDQAEAEAGTATTRRAFTAQRVFQGIAAWWAGSAAKAKLDGLATVATTGAYGDLSGRPTLGTAAAANTGTTAGNVVVLDGSARLPAVDGSQLTNLPSNGVPLTDGDKGDITVSASGTTWTIDNGAVDTANLGGDITAAGKALLDDTDAAAQRTTLGAQKTITSGTTAPTGGVDGDIYLQYS